MMIREKSARPPCTSLPLALSIGVLLSLAASPAGARQDLNGRMSHTPRPAHTQDTASQAAPTSATIATSNTEFARQAPPQQPQQPQQMRLGGKCALKGLCSAPNSQVSRGQASGPELARMPAGPGRGAAACHCDERCHLFDDCCPDSRRAEPLARRLELGADMLRARRRGWLCKRVNPMDGAVLLKASCLPDWGRGEANQTLAELVRRGCESAHETAPGHNGPQSDPMGSLMPITDLASGVTYANSYCLRCNTLRGQQQQAASSAGRRRLIYWSPQVNCNYNLDSDDRNLLYDLISSKGGQALVYSPRLNKWLVKMPPQQPDEAAHTQPSEPGNSSEPSGERVCSISATIPDSIKQTVRHCWARVLDSCPSVAAVGADAADEELRRAQFECGFGHQSLVYGQTSELAYYNLACAKCNRDPDVSCEPRRFKQSLVVPARPESRLPPGSQTTTASHYAAGRRPASQYRANNSDLIMSSPPVPTLEQPMPDNQLDSIESKNALQPGDDSETQLAGSLTVLIDLYGGARDNSDQVGAVHRCQDTESQVYDPFLLTCRDIVCGLNLRYLEGNCIQVEANEESLASNLLAASNITNSSPDAMAATSTAAASIEPMHSHPSTSTWSSNSNSNSRPAAADSSAPTQVAAVQAELASSSGRKSSEKLIQVAHQDEQQTRQQEQARPVSSTVLPPASKQDAPGQPAQARPHQQANSSSESMSPATELGQQMQEDKSFNEQLKELKQLPMPTSESRKAFAECGKILIEPEHYRLFTLDDLNSGATRSDFSLARTNYTQQQQAATASDHNLWALVAPYNLTLASSQFELVRSQPTAPGQPPSFKLFVCSPFKSDLVNKFKPMMAYLTTCGLAVSIASLVCYLLLYCLSTFDLRHLAIELAQAGQMNESLRSSALDLRFRGSRASNDASLQAMRSQSLSSRGVACLAGSLLAAYLLFVLGHHHQDAACAPGTLSSCTLIAAGTYCAFLLAFNWMFLLSYDIWRTLRLATCHLRGPSTNSQSTRFLVYAFGAGAVAIGLTVLALVLDQVDPMSIGCHPEGQDCSRLQMEWEHFVQIYRPKFGQRAGSCWFSNRRSLALFFGLPVTLIMFVNLLFFLHCSFMVIRTSSRSSRRPRSGLPSSSGSQQHHPSYLSSCHLGDSVDFAQQNSLTTSSISTIQSTISASSAQSSPCNSTMSADEVDQDEQHEALKQKQLQQQQQHRSLLQAQIEEASKRLEEQRSSFSNSKQMSSASLISSQGGRSQTSTGHSIISSASNLALKCENNLSAFMAAVVKDYRLYCRLSTIMGLTWLTGLMASVVDQSETLWYLFLVLNTLQGLFIFVAFGFKRSRLTNLQLLMNYIRYRLSKCNLCRGRDDVKLEAGEEDSGRTNMRAPSISDF